MFNHVRRHQKWLWVLISAAVIISFTVYFNPQNDFSSVGGTQYVGTIGGERITTSDYRQAEVETILGLFMQYGQWPDRDDMMRQMKLVERQVPNRLFLLHKIDELDIEVSETGAANWILNTFRDPQTRAFSRQIYDQFLQRLAERGISQGQFSRFARNQAAIEHLVNVAGAPGKLVPPQEAETLYRQENEEVEAQLVLFQGTNYISQVSADPAAIAQYYTNNAAVYRKPERLVVNFIAFPLSNYHAQADTLLAQQTNLNEQIDAIYARRGTNYYTETNGLPMSVEKAKAQIRDDARDDVSRREAQRAAAEFLTKLVDMEPRTPENLVNLAAASGLQVQVSEPFSQFDRPANLDADLQNAFALTAEEPFLEEPIMGPEGVYVIGFKNRVPSELPPLDEVRQKVVEDYQRTQSSSLARNAGQAFHRAMTNAIAAGEAFEAAAQGAGYKVIKLAPFAQTTPSTPELPESVDFSSVKNTAFALQPKEVSNFTFTRDGGYVLQTIGRIPVSENKLKLEFPNYLTTLRRSRQGQAFNEWFEKQREATPVNLPGLLEDSEQ